MPSANNYKPVLSAFISYLDGHEYDKNHVFPQERLAQVTAAQVVRYFNYVAYRKEQPDEADRPIFARSSSLAHYKKCISFFMPNKHMQWNELTNQGNPTKYHGIGTLLSKIKRFEVRGEGASSKACRPLTLPEFVLLQNKFRQNVLDHDKELIVTMGIPSLNAYQFSMIGRVDDVTLLKTENLKPHNLYPNLALLTRLQWSKNVMEERDAPWQILLGGRDPNYCTHVNLSVWIESQLELNPFAANSPYVFSFNPDIRFPEGGEKSKRFVQTQVRKVYATDGFENVNDPRPKGTHSVRKCASTTARNNGSSKDDKDTRARWKSGDRDRTSSVYDSPELPFIDAKVCENLCIGGAIVYMVREGSGVDEEFLKSQVAPAIRAKYGEQMAITLGKALLWTIFSEMDQIVPAMIRQRVRAAYTGLGDRIIGDDENPVEKLTVHVGGSRENGNLVLTVLNGAGGAGVIAVGAGNANDQNAAVVGVGGGVGPNNDVMNVILDQVNGIRQAQIEFQQQLQQLATEMRRGHRRTAANFQRIANEPHRMIAAAANAGNGNNNNAPNAAPAIATAGIDPRAKLSPTPRNLSVLWQEYTRGIGGRKPAREFTPQERGQRSVKHKYHLRNVLWKLILNLIANAQHNSNSAIDRIYAVYGRDKSVTQLVRAIKADVRNRRMHPDLRLGFPGVVFLH